MSLLDCINKAADEGIINKAKQVELELDYNTIYNEYIEKGFSKTHAAKMAGLDTFDNLKFKASIKAKQSLITSRLQEEFLQQMKTFRNAKGEIDYGSVIKQKFNWTENPEGIKRIASFEEELDIVQGAIDTEIERVLINFRHNLLGSNRNKATLLTTGREIFNRGSTGNKAAQEIAEAWDSGRELSRKLFNDAGGSIPKLDGVYGLPTKHSTALVDEVDYITWRKLFEDNNLLDLENMIDYNTGKPFTKEQFELTMRDVYETIASDGYNKNPKHNFSSNIGNRRMDHRFLKFKDFDSWLIYHKRFGETYNVFDVMIDHLRSMSRDIAMMRILSPNPQNFLRWMKQTAMKELKTSKLKNKQKLIQKLEKDMITADNSLLYHSGDTFKPANRMMAKGMAGLREATTAMYLGSAAVLSINDFNTSAISAKFAGLPALKTMSSNLKMFLQGFDKDKSTLIKIAGTSGMVSEHFSGIASGLNRMSIKEVESPLLTKRAADFVLRSSGLSWLTQAGRWGVGMEVMAFLAREIGTSFDEMKIKNPDFFNILETNNISKSDWDIIRATKLYDAGIDDPKYKGALFLKPVDILKRTDLPDRVIQEMHRKTQRLVNYIIDFAIPDAKARGAIKVLGSTKPGTILGETGKSFLQFKQFPFTIHLSHITRGWGRKTIGGKVGYLAPFLISTTAVGMLSYELKQITKGKDVTNYEKMDKGDWSKYVLNNMLHGGGLGFIGDVLFSGQYGGAKGTIATLAGSVPLFIAEIIDLSFGTARKYVTGEKVNLGGRMADFIKKNFPGGSIWYLRLAIERWIFDTLSDWIDPKYSEKRKRLNKKVNREQNTKFWWKPGRKFPSRPPEF